MNETWLVCNAGSASLKLCLTDVGTGLLMQTTLENDPDQEWEQQLSQWLSNIEHSSEHDIKQAAIVLHRIVHAGAVSESPVKLDASVKARIRHWQSLAPLHNPPALKLIATIERMWPDCVQFAVFDSGLYSELPDLSRRYALPDTISSKWPIQRYGFHGLAHRSQMRTLQQQGDFKRVISLQLGGGTSATAWLDGKPVDTTMGFSPLEGLPMGSRSGSIDPGILLHLLQNESCSIANLEQILSCESGLKALSGGTADMRDLINNSSIEAQFAVAYYCYQIRKLLGSYIAILGGLDAVTIGGGIGENQPLVRNNIFSAMAHLSLVLDETINSSASGTCALHDSNSSVAIWLTPVDETFEMMNQYSTYKRLHRL